MYFLPKYLITGAKTNFHETPQQIPSRNFVYRSSQKSNKFELANRMS